MIKTAPNSLSDGWAKVESEAAAAEQVPPPLLRISQLVNWLAPGYDLWPAMIDAGWIRWWTALRATPPTPPGRGTLACLTSLRIVSASFSTSSTRSPSPSWRGCPRAFTLWYRLTNIGGKPSSEWSTNTPTYLTGSKVTIPVLSICIYFCKSATQYKTPAIRPRSRWEKRRRGWGRLARKRTGEHDIFFGHFKNEPMHCIAMFQNWYIFSFQRYCQGVEHVLEEERQVQAKHPAQLPVLLSERRSTKNCKFCVRIKLWGVKWGNMWEQSKTFYCARDFRYLFIRNPWQLDIYQTKRRRIPQLQSYHASVCRDCSTLPPKDRRPPRCCLTFPLVQQAAQSCFLMMLIVPDSKIPRP